MHYHYYNIDTRITIGKYQFSAVKSLKIETSIENFSDKAEIEIPREFKTNATNNLPIAGKNLFEVINIGDIAIIEIGYNGELAQEFKGYISKIHADIPLVLELEDEMYQLKKLPKINKTFASVSLKKLLDFIAPKYEVETFQMPLGKYTIENATPFKVIEHLKDTYGVRCFFREKKLVAGLTIDFKPQKTHQFVFGKNIRNTSSLKYITKQERKRYYKGVSLQKGTSKKIIFEYGDKDGDHRTLNLPVNLTKQEVKQWVEKFYKSNNTEGYDGNIDSWGIPRTRAGESAQIIDPNYEDGYRNMKLLIESVTIYVNESDGFKRQNKLSYKLS